jgi:hypothetical protein
MNSKKRLEDLEKKLDNGEEKTLYIFRVKHADGTTTDHEKKHKGYKGKPQIIECSEADWKL